ncbi:hypothetical protein [Bacillus sp. FJAT-27225]|uniref:hypothetical protein n=1 Tax=Bacillus sp. FJAT-27225 TaxID=1743144 RepID=UPI001112869B|nr:hypothetical protein [Bacillus sp. FJAT-27225]
MFKYFSWMSSVLAILLVFTNPLPFSDWFAFATILFGCGYGLISIVKERDGLGKIAFRLNVIISILISFQLV